MSELIADLPYRVLDTQGQEFYVSVAGEQRPEGEWEGWLEFVPLDESDALLTPTETTQSNRAALQHWAEALKETYVQGAFPRAVGASVGTFRSRTVIPHVVPQSQSVPLNDVDLPDPFQLYDSGLTAMHARLNALSRAVLLEMIETFGLNPAGKNIVWLSDRQLVTFLFTAVEAQIAMGRRSVF